LTGSIDEQTTPDETCLMYERGSTPVQS